MLRSGKGRRRRQMNDLKKMSETDEEGHTTRYIVGASRTYTEMYERYHFTEQQIQLCQELMSDDYYAFWSNFVSESMGYGSTDWGGVSTVDPDYTPIMSGSVMKIPAIYQFDYKKVVCTIGGQGKSASTSGCGATSMCMVIHYLTGNTTEALVGTIQNCRFTKLKFFQFFSQQLSVKASGNRFDLHNIFWDLIA